jgi:hypothetical protein
MTQITIPQEQWGAMVGAAVLQTVTSENRDTLIKEAIRYLLVPSKNDWDRGITPLQIAFDEALKIEANKILQSEISKDSGILSEVRKMITEAVEKATTGERRGKIVDKMADALAAGLRLEDRY